MHQPVVNPEAREAGALEAPPEGLRARARLTEGPVGPALVQLGAPMVVGMASIVLFNVVDTYFVAQLGTRELTAMSFTFPIVALVGGAALGLAVAATSVVSRAVGTGDEHRVRRLATDALFLALLVVGVVAGIGVLTIDPVFRLLGASEDVLPLIRQYMAIWYAGSVFVVVPMVANGSIRARGDTRTPALIMLVAGGVNALLDPILIFGWGPFPRMELAGAAIATVIARALTLLLALWVLSARERMLARGWPGFAEVWRSWRALLHIGVPSAGAYAIIPLTAAVLTWIVAGYGERAVAAFGVGTRVDMLAGILPVAVSAGLSPFVGQNWGAGRCDRVARAVQLCQRFGLFYGAALYLPLALLAPLIGAGFSDDPSVVAIVAVYLVLSSLGHGFHGVVMVSSSAFNATGQPFKGAFIAFLRTAGLGIPLAWLGGWAFGLVGVFAAAPIANLLASLLAHAWTRYLRCTEDGEKVRLHQRENEE